MTRHVPVCACVPRPARLQRPAMLDGLRVGPGGHGGHGPGSCQPRAGRTDALSGPAHSGNRLTGPLDRPPDPDRGRVPEAPGCAEFPVIASHSHHRPDQTLVGRRKPSSCPSFSRMLLIALPSPSPTIGTAQMALCMACLRWGTESLYTLRWRAPVLLPGFPLEQALWAYPGPVEPRTRPGHGPWRRCFKEQVRRLTAGASRQAPRQQCP